MCASEPAQTVEVPARQGVALRLKQGTLIRLTNTHGTQVIDTWAFCADDMTEYMSMEHSRAFLLKLSPEVGDSMVTNRRRPILTLVRDTSPGQHDTLVAACDITRYRQLGVEGYHDSCTDNLHAGLAGIGLTSAITPGPLNIFMSVPVSAGGRLSFDPPLSKAGDYLELRAEMDCVLAMSACPQDITLVNGKEPKPFHYRIA